MAVITAHRANPGKDIDVLTQQLNAAIVRINILTAWANTLVAKLNLDAGVTDVNYATIVSTAVDTVALGY